MRGQSATRRRTRISLACCDIRELSSCPELTGEIGGDTRAAPNNECKRQGSTISDEELGLGSLTRLDFHTKQFHPLKIWQLKNMFENATTLARAGLEPKEIAERMTFRDVEGIQQSPPRARLVRLLTIFLCGQPGTDG